MPPEDTRPKPPPRDTLACLPERVPPDERPTEPPLRDSGISYVETLSDIINPGRGFYTPINKRFEAEANTPISAALIKQHARRFGLLHLRFGLEAFSANAGGTDRPLTDDMLAALDQTLLNVRQAGVTAIVRFSYDIRGIPTDDGHYVEAEPSMTLIEQHIRQIGAVLEQYTDVISCVETGMFGPWGEQHGTVRSTESEDNYYRLVEAWLDAVPTSRTINVRRPLYYIYWANRKYGLQLTTDTIDTHRAEPGSAAYRVGIYNDGYLGSVTDLGTFSNREKEVLWLNAQAKHTFYGGEVVADSETGAIGAFNNIAHISREAFITHTTYLNMDWNYTDVIRHWEKTPYTGDDEVYRNKATAFTYINNRLGYRLVLRESRLSDGVQPGGALVLKGRVENVGFGNVINRKVASVILQHEEHPDIVHPFPVDLDVREWASQAVSDYHLLLELPADMEPGRYRTYLRFADAYEQSEIPAHRAIRFANDDDIWNDLLGANFIGEFAVAP